MASVSVTHENSITLYSSYLVCYNGGGCLDVCATLFTIVFFSGVTYESTRSY